MIIKIIKLILIIYGAIFVAAFCAFVLWLLYKLTFDIMPWVLIIAIEHWVFGIMAIIMFILIMYALRKELK